MEQSLRTVQGKFLGGQSNTYLNRNEVCIDCGQRGDRRLMTNTCHLMKFEPTRLPGKKKVCSQCKQCSYRIICGYRRRFTPAQHCVGWGNHVSPGLTVAPPEKTEHELRTSKGRHCAAGIS